MTDKQRFIVIMTMVLGLVSFGIAVALGHVEEKSSYGLTGVLLILGQIATGVIKSDRNREPEKPVEPVVVPGPPPPPPIARGGFGETGSTETPAL